MISKTKYSIETNNINIGYQNKQKPIILLKELNLKAKEGNLIALIGENGSGKSTFLRTLLRLHNSLSGQVLLFDKPINSYSLNKLARLISFVSTEVISIQNMTVFNLVSMGRFPYTNWIGKLYKEDKDIIYESLSLVGMAGFIHKNIDEISDGERQRVLIARTLAQDTPVIVLDEPTSFLDLANKFEIIHLLRTLAVEKNKTIIFSTHDLNIALQEADLFWLIKNNNIVEGIPEDLILNGKFDELFENSKLNFNSETGFFSINKNNSKNLNFTLSGTGKVFFWTEKALMRTGFRINEIGNTDGEILIENENNKAIWIFSVSGKSDKFDSIEQLIQYIKLKFNL
ncbi:MAG: ABC transporter ATP-binding protein [Chlorobi bacterium]|nr:ABC transporter ATP-binding protein [Chlorobiota bacterium]